MKIRPLGSIEGRPLHRHAGKRILTRVVRHFGSPPFSKRENFSRKKSLTSPDGCCPNGNVCSSAFSSRREPLKSDPRGTGPVRPLPAGCAGILQQQDGCGMAPGCLLAACGMPAALEGMPAGCAGIQGMPARCLQGMPAGCLRHACMPACLQACFRHSAGHACGLRRHAPAGIRFASPGQQNGENA